MILYIQLQHSVRLTLVFLRFLSFSFYCIRPVSKALQSLVLGRRDLRLNLGPGILGRPNSSISSVSVWYILLFLSILNGRKPWPNWRSSTDSFQQKCFYFLQLNVNQMRRKNSKSILINSAWLFYHLQNRGTREEEKSKNYKISNKLRLKSRIKWLFKICLYGSDIYNKSTL